MAKAGLLFVGTDDGLVLFSNPNNIGRWLRIGQPFKGQSVRAVWPVPDNPLVVYAAVAGAGLHRSDDGGQSWRPVLDGDITTIGGARDGARMVVLDDKSVHCATAAADDWSLCQPVESGETTTLIVLNPDVLHLAIGTSNGVWSSDDGGESWQRFGENAPAFADALAAAPGGTAPLYVVADGQLYQCLDAASPWQQVAGAPAARPLLVVLGGKTPVMLLAQAGGGLARSDDGGATWSIVEAAAAISALTGVSYHIDIAFAGTREGRLLTSTDRGRTWETIKDNLPPIQSVAAARLI